MADRLEQYVFFKDRPEWNDVVPLPLTENEIPVCQIAYSDKFKDIFGYYKAVMVTGEESERVFKIIQEAIELNVANYSLWSHRRRMIRSLNKDINCELNYVTRLIDEDPKVYQLWYHRMELVKIRDTCTGEIDFCDSVLNEDPKNYHAWQYRCWLLDNFQLWAEDREWRLVRRLLTEDPYNNSAWNHRYQIVCHTTGFDCPKTLKQELCYALNSVHSGRADNESPWNYLSAVFSHMQPEAKEETVVELEMTLDKLLGDIEAEDQLPSLILKNYRLRVDFLAHYYYNENRQKPEKLFQYATLLRDHLDPIRRGYWSYIMNCEPQEIARS